MITLSYTAAQKMFNSGKEVTAQCISANLQELNLGTSPDAYMPARDAAELLPSTAYQAGLNPVYVHLLPAGLRELLKKHTFVITEDED